MTKHDEEPPEHHLTPMEEMLRDTAENAMKEKDCVQRRWISILAIAAGIMTFLLGYTMNISGQYGNTRQQVAVNTDRIRSLEGRMDVFEGLLREQLKSSQGMNAKLEFIYESMQKKR